MISLLSCHGILLAHNEFYLLNQNLFIFYWLSSRNRQFLYRKQTGSKDIVTCKLELRILKKIDQPQRMRKSIDINELQIECDRVEITQV